jgi:hypothetical protein
MKLAVVKQEDWSWWVDMSMSTSAEKWVKSIDPMAKMRQPLVLHTNRIHEGLEA